MAWLIDRDRFNRPTGIVNTVSRPTVTLDIARRVEAQPPDGGAREALIAERRRALARLGEQQELGAGMSSLQATMQQRLNELTDVQAGLEEAGLFRQAAIQAVEDGQQAVKFGNRLGEAKAEEAAQFQISTLIDQFKPEAPSADYVQRAIWSQNTTDDNFYEYARELEGIQRFRDFKSQMDILDEAGEQRLMPLAAGFAKEGIRGSEFQSAVNSLRKGDLTAISEIPIERQAAYNRLLRSITPTQPTEGDPLNFRALDDDQPENFFPEARVSPEQTRNIGEAFLDSSVRFEDIEEAFQESGIEAPGRGRQLPFRELLARQEPVRNLLKEAQTFKQEQGNQFVSEAVLSGIDPKDLQFVIDVSDRVNMTPQQFQRMPKSFQQSTFERFTQELQAKEADKSISLPNLPQQAIDDLFRAEQEIFASRTRPKINALLEKMNIPGHETISKYMAEVIVPTSAVGFIGKAPKAVGIGRRVVARIKKFGFKEGLLNMKQDEQGRLERGETPQTPEEAMLIFLLGAGASGVAPEAFSLFGRVVSTLSRRAGVAGRAIPGVADLITRLNTTRLELRLPRFDFESDPNIVRILDEAGVETQVDTGARQLAAGREAITETSPSTASLKLGGKGRIRENIPNQEIGESLLVEPVITTSGKVQSAASAEIGTLVARKNSPSVVFGRIVAKTKRGAVVLDNANKRHTVPYRQLQPVTEKVLGPEPTIQSVSQIAGAEGGGRAVGFDLTQPGGVAPDRLPAVVTGEAPQAPLTRGVTAADPDVARRLLQDVPTRTLPDVPGQPQRLLPEKAPSDAGPAPARDLLGEVTDQVFNESLPTVKGTVDETINELAEMLDSGVNKEARVNLSVDNGPVEELSIGEAVEILRPRIDNPQPSADEIVERSIKFREEEFGVDTKITVEDTLPANIKNYSGFMTADSKLVSVQFPRDDGIGTVTHDELLRMLGYRNKKNPSIANETAARADGLIRITRPGKILWGAEADTFGDIQRVAQSLRRSGLPDDTPLAYDVVDPVTGLPDTGSIPKGRLEQGNIGEASIKDIIDFKQVAATVPEGDVPTAELADIVGRPAKPNEGKLVTADDGEVFTGKALETERC